MSRSMWPQNLGSVPYMTVISNMTPRRLDRFDRCLRRIDQTQSRKRRREGRDTVGDITRTHQDLGLPFLSGQTPVKVRHRRMTFFGQWNVSTSYIYHFGAFKSYLVICLHSFPAEPLLKESGPSQYMEVRHPNPQ